MALGVFESTHSHDNYRMFGSQLKALRAIVIAKGANKLREMSIKGLHLIQ
jgi:hypothetical protein